MLTSFTFLVFFILMQGVFAGLETGMISIRRPRIEHAYENGSRAAKMILFFLDNPGVMISTSLLGVNISVVCASLAAKKFAESAGLSSAAGLLGVEGMEDSILYDLLRPYAAESGSPAAARLQDNPLSKTDLFRDGLTGCPDSSARRDALCHRIGLPAGMTSGALLAALRMLMTYDEYLALVGREREKQRRKGDQKQRDNEN